jgi:pimeloyl-ACP methyl ester carboxylesterase
MLRALLVCCGFVGAPADVQTHFQQLHPARVAPGPIMPAEMDFHSTPGRSCAVVLIHGCNFQLTAHEALRPKIPNWQKSGRPLVLALGQCADVYAFRYGQNVRVDDIPHVPALREGVARLKRLGYRHLVLLGHSAGAIVARQFVEDYPDAGVTKVVQVCAINGGWKWVDVARHVKLPALLNATQAPFLNSLAVEERQKAAARRAKNVPAAVQFLCVIGGKDKLASRDSQWPTDLKAQGIPSVELPLLPHLLADCGEADCKRLSDLLVKDHPRSGPRPSPVPSAALPDGPAASPGDGARPASLNLDQLNWLLPVSPAKRPRTPAQGGGEPAPAPAGWSDQTVIARGKKLIRDNAENICLFSHAFKTYGFEGHNFVSHSKTKDGYHDLRFEFTVKGIRYTRRMQMSFFFKRDGRFAFLTVHKSTTLYEPFKQLSKSYLKELRGQMARGPVVASHAELLRSVDGCDAQELCELHLKLVQFGREPPPSVP